VSSIPAGAPEPEAVPRRPKARRRLTVAGGLLWLAILILITLSDFMTRGWLPVLR
jgi:hypothetical protein